MNKEDLAKELWLLIDGDNKYPDFSGDSVMRKIYLECAEYLLDHYHLIKKEGTKGIEGELNIVWGNDGITCGIDIDYEKSEGVPDYDGKYARLFIEEEK